MESGQWYFLNPPTQQATENYNIYRYFDSEYKSKVITAEDKFSTNLQTLATNDPGLATFEHFYKTPSSSTNTIHQKTLTTERLSPSIQKYVDSICNFDNLLDWSSIASSMRSTPQQPYPFSGEKRNEMWSESHQKEYVYESKNSGQLEQCIRHIEQNSTVQKHEIVIEREFVRDEEIRQILPSQTDSNKLQPFEPPTENYFRPTKSFDEIESPRMERKIMHGKVLNLTGKTSPAYLLRTNSTCNAGLITGFYKFQSKNISYF